MRCGAGSRAPHLTPRAPCCFNYLRNRAQRAQPRDKKDVSGIRRHSPANSLQLAAHRLHPHLKGDTGEAMLGFARWNFRAFAVGSVLGLAALWGCSSLPGGGAAAGSEDEGPVGSAQFAVKIVPNDVRCIQITAAGSRSLTSSFDVTPNQAAQLTMPGLPAGAVTFSALAFSVPCSQVTAASVPGWSSAPVVGQVIPGGIIQVTLVMMQAGSANIGIEFPGTGGASGSSGAGGSSGSAGKGGGANGGSGGNGNPPLGVWDSTNWDNALWQ